MQVGVEGLQILKPQAQKHILQDGLPLEGRKEAVHSPGGINLESSIVLSHDDVNLEMVKWTVENFKFSVNQLVKKIKVATFLLLSFVITRGDKSFSVD